MKKKKKISFFDKYSKIFTILAFVLIFILGVSFITKLNVNFDTRMEQDILKSNLKEYARFFNLKEAKDYYNKLDIPYISEYIERDHGVAAYYLFTPFLLFDYVSINYTDNIWFFYTFSIFFIGIIFFYKLVDYLFKDKKVSLISTLLYASFPRMFIDGIHNNKDVVLMSLLIIMLYYGFKFINEKDKKSLILFSIVSGFVCNTKVIGLLFLGIIGLGYIINVTIKKEWSKRNFIYGLSAALLSLIIYIILTPAIWGKGKIELFEFISYCFDNSISFRASPTVLFEGTLYQNPVKPLPWYYIPKMMLITIPIITSLYFAYGFIKLSINSIKDIIAKKINDLNFKIILVFIIMIIPLMTAILSKPVLYNGWRHFYFLYPLVMIIAVYGISSINKKEFKLHKYVKYINIITIILIATNFMYIIKYDVANTAYFNILIKRKNLDQRYELDYYNVTAKQALIKFYKSTKLKDNEGEYYIYGDGFNEMILNLLFECNDFKIKEKFAFIRGWQIEDVLSRGKTVYVYNNPIYSSRDFSNSKKVYSYTTFNNSHIVDFYEVTKLEEVR